MINFFKKLFKISPMRQKILKIKKDLKLVVKSHCKENFWIDWYGAYEFLPNAPESLMFWICVKTDKEKMILLSNQKLESEFREILKMNSYSVEAVMLVGFGVESQETVNREYDGDWYLYFKS